MEHLIETSEPSMADPHNLSVATSDELLRSRCKRPELEKMNVINENLSKLFDFCREDLESAGIGAS